MCLRYVLSLEADILDGKTRHGELEKRQTRHRAIEEDCFGNTDTFTMEDLFWETLQCKVVTSLIVVVVHN